MLTNCRLPAAVSLWLLALAPLSAADWPGFRGPTGQGAAIGAGYPVEWSTEKNVAWRVELPGAGGSSPAVFGDRIYLTSYSGYGVPGQSGSLDALQRQLVCLDRANGKTIWNTPTPAKRPEQASIRDEHGYATSTPAIDADRIYVFYGKSGARAFGHDGKEQWHADVGDELHGWGSAASPVLYGDLVFINASVESASLYALDRSTGREKWRVRGIKESWNTPVIVRSADGRDELIVAIFGKVLGLDPQTGEQLWSCDTGISWYMVPSIVAHNGVIYCIGGRTGGSLAVRTGGRGDVTATHRLWTGKKGSNVSSPVLHHGHLFFAHEQLGIVYCVEAATGNVVYEDRLPRGGQMYPSAVLADGKVYFTSRTGKTFVIRAEPKFELLAVNDLDDRSLFHASPAFAAGRIYVRSDRHLTCLATAAP